MSLPAAVLSSSLQFLREIAYARLELLYGNALDVLWVLKPTTTAALPATSTL